MTPGSTNSVRAGVFKMPFLTIKILLLVPSAMRLLLSIMIPSNTPSFRARSCNTICERKLHDFIWLLIPPTFGALLWNRETLTPFSYEYSGIPSKGRACITTVGGVSGSIASPGSCSPRVTVNRIMASDRRLRFSVSQTTVRSSCLVIGNSKKMRRADREQRSK